MKRFLTRLRPAPPRPFPLVQVEPTLACNVHCAMCPWLPLHSPQHVMSDATFDAIARQFPVMQGVDLSGGGEPLFHPRLVEMVQIAHEAGCTVGFSTNGTLLTPKVSEELVRAGLDWIAFSVDAGTAPTYESIRIGAHFEQVLANIEALGRIRASGQGKPAMFLVYVLMRRNLEELSAAMDWATARGIERIVVKNLDLLLKPGDERQSLVEMGEEEKEGYRRVLDEARARAEAARVHLRVYSSNQEENWMCEINPRQNLFINWEGYLSPCITLAYGRRHYFQGQWRARPSVRFGNVREAELPVLWDREPYREFRSTFQRRERVWLAHALTVAAEGNTQPVSSFLPDAPPGCRTCYYLYEN